MQNTETIKQYKPEVEQIVSISIQRVGKPVGRQISETLFCVDVGSFGNKLTFYFTSEAEAKEIFNLHSK